MPNARPCARRNLKSRKPEQPIASQNRMTVGSLTPALRAVLARVAPSTKPGFFKTSSATFRSEFRNPTLRVVMTSRMFRAGSMAVRSLSSESKLKHQERKRVAANVAKLRQNVAARQAIIVLQFAPPACGCANRDARLLNRRGASFVFSAVNTCSGREPRMLSGRYAQR